MAKMLDSVRATVKTTHANLSALFAIIGGFLAALSVIGKPVVGLARIGPWWMPLLWWVALMVVCVGDWANDSVPNRPAVYTALVWPSCFVAALTGESGRHLFDALRVVDGAVHANVTAPVQKFITDLFTVSASTNAAFTAFSLLFITAAVVYAHRYAKKAKKTDDALDAIFGGKK